MEALHRIIESTKLDVFTFPAGRLINSPFKKVNALIKYKNLLSKQQINSIYLP